MRIALVFVFFVSTFALLHGGAEEDWTRLGAEALPKEWTDFRERVVSRPWVVAEFEEKRFFGFRSRPVELTGTVWYGREEGLTLHYREPRREVIRVDERGARIIRDDGRRRDRSIPERGREVPSALLSLFRLDFGELQETFELHGWRHGNEWALRLNPHDPDDAPIERIELAGVEDEVTRIEIEQSDRRRIELTFSDTAYPPKLDAEVRKRIFP